MLITFPPVLALDEAPLKNPVRQLTVPSQQRDGQLANFVHNRIRGHLFQPAGGGDAVLLLHSKHAIPAGYDRVLQATVNANAPASDLSRAEWLRHPAMRAAFNHDAECVAAVESWRGSFSYVAEDVATNTKGLRKPQIGAVHAVHAHWAVSNATATVVMPTGTGKTETMLSVLVSTPCRRILVVVPTDTLRTQLSEKFLTLGILKDEGAAILTPMARRPVVCVLKHFLRTPADVDDILGRANVIVTTSIIAGQCDPEVRHRMAHHCDALFVDEAHHAEAPTWLAFKDAFAAKRILQFTATPFREDGKPLDGDIIFKYPMSRAQEEGYFRPISFVPVNEFNVARVDETIAEAAVERLRQEYQLGHVLMARVDGVARAQKVFDIYNRHPDLNPVQIHTGIKSSRQREEIRHQIVTGHARVIVCVDMLGEGFDLPTLKIAAFHDIRKTLAVTLQLAGRFTRARPDLGNATFIANTAEVQVRDELRKLYTRDPDWNILLPQLNDQMIGEQMALQEFLRGFTNFTKEIPLKTVRPATSAVVFRTNCEDWTPENFRDGLPAIGTCEQVHYAINAAAHTMVIVTARRVQVEWTDVEHIFSWDWELYVLFWSRDQNLLYIHGSTNAGEYRALARAVGGPNASLIQGQDVFKTFAGVNRLRLQNVGLTEQLGRNVRYTGRMGADVEGGMTAAQRQRAVKSVLSGGGFEGGRRVSVGASRKGRIWSHRRDRVDEFVDWCCGIGAKLLDPNIDPAEILQGTLEGSTVDQRPAVMPISVDWPEEVYTSPESQWTVLIGDGEFQLGEVDIDIVTPTLAGPVRFAIVARNDRVEFELELFRDGDNPNYRYTLRGDRPARIRHGGPAATPYICTEWFYDHPPVVWFADGSSLEGNIFVPLKHPIVPFDRERLQAWEWADVDIRKESQGAAREADSIQAKVIRELLLRDYTIVFDDDDPGEAADVVAIRVVGGLDAPTALDVEFYHCKFSGAVDPGHRVGDLYEVCGQAQKSTAWVTSHDKKSDLFTHLLRREAKRVDAGGQSRYQRGNKEQLLAMREISRIWPVRVQIAIVQPGVSKATASQAQLTLIGVTENYLHETYNLRWK